MTRVFHLDAYCVVLPVKINRDGFPPRTEDELKRESDRLLKATKYHVGAYSRDADTAFIRQEGHDMCSHCGATWRGKNDKYNNGCCEADRVAVEKRE